MGGIGYWCGEYQTRSTYVEMEQHPLCYDTDKYEAWVARKGDEFRCFMEKRSYPHTVKGSYLDGDT